MVHVARVTQNSDGVSRLGLGLESFRTRFGLKPVILRFWILQRYCLVKLLQHAFCLLYLQIRNNKSK